MICRKAHRTFQNGASLVLISFVLGSAIPIAKAKVDAIVAPLDLNPGSDITTSVFQPESAHSRQFPQLNLNGFLSAATSSSIADANPIERKAFELTNSVRVEHGRVALFWDAELWRLARDYSEKMARQGFFSHVAPDGSDLRDRARLAGIRFRAIGENIAYNRGYDDPGASTVQRWLDSAPHRSNLLGREFRASAVGVFVSSNGRVYVTQLFITR